MSSFLLIYLISIESHLFWACGSTNTYGRHRPVSEPSHSSTYKPIHNPGELILWGTVEKDALRFASMDPLLYYNIFQGALDCKGKENYWRLWDESFTSERFSSFKRKCRAIAVVGKDKTNYPSPCHIDQPDNPRCCSSLNRLGWLFCRFNMYIFGFHCCKL